MLPLCFAAPPKKLNVSLSHTKILIDLARLTLAFVFLISVSMIVRHIIGPFGHVAVVELIMASVQSLYDLILACIVSLQVSQVCQVFFYAKVNEIKEENLFYLHRVFVLGLGLSTAFYICHLKGGMCKPTPTYYFLLKVRALSGSALALQQDD